MDLGSFHADNSKDFVLRSLVPADVADQDVIVGIDEAGRGPVLGPMVYGACYVARRSEPLLTTLKVADSKTLTEEQRDSCFRNLETGKDSFGWIAQILSPAGISRSMLSRSKYNLNAISHDSAMFLIQSIIDMNVHVTEVFLDTVGDPGKYQAKLKERFPAIGNITVSKKADSLFPVVSAASIVAKVCRDKALKEWRFVEGSRFGIDGLKYGSGYPADPETKRFLQEHRDSVFGYPQLIRFSWSTTDKALEGAVAVKWEDVLPEDASTPSITRFFKKQEPAGKVNHPQHRFFVERNLNMVADFSL